MEITEDMIMKVAEQYPEANIVRIPEENPQEVVFEIAKSPDDSWSVAIAIIVESTPHVHHEIWETYKVLEGKLRLTDRDNTEHGTIMEAPGVDIENSQHTCGVEVIEPTRVHSAQAVGSPATVLVLASPAWKPEDHHLREDFLPFSGKK